MIVYNRVDYFWRVMKALKFGLKEVALIAIVASALNLLDGELFYLAQLRGAESFRVYGWRQISSLAPQKINIATYVGVLGNIISVKVYNLAQESGIFTLYLISLILGAVLYLKTLERTLEDSVLAFILATLGVIGVVSSTKDLSIALAFLLCSAELWALSDRRTKIRLFIIPLCLAHCGIDSSYLLSLGFYFMSLCTYMGFFLGTLLLLKSAFVVCQGGLRSPYSECVSLLAFLLGFVVSLRSKNTTIIVYAIFTSAAFFLWDWVFGQRFPALCFFGPFIVAKIWSISSPLVKQNFVGVFAKLKNNLDNLLTVKNKFAFLFLCSAFIFLQTSTKFFHPINEAYLPKEAMDVFVESKPISPPLHPIDVGGYVGFRLAPLLNSTQPLNYLDMSSKLMSLPSKSVDPRQYQSLWRGENQHLLDEIGAKTVLCQGKDLLCQKLKTKDDWKILSHSTFGGKILEKLGTLSAKQKEFVSRKLEDESWYLLSEKDSAFNNKQ